MKPPIPLKEVKTLMAAWAKDPVQGTISASIRYHFSAHGVQVGATDVWQYLRKVETFRRNLRGATRRYLEEGKVRYTKKGHYIILDVHRSIVSYGAERLDYEPQHD